MNSIGKLDWETHEGVGPEPTLDSYTAKTRGSVIIRIQLGSVLSDTGSHEARVTLDMFDGLKWGYVQGVYLTQFNGVPAAEVRQTLAAAYQPAVEKLKKLADSMFDPLIPVGTLFEQVLLPSIMRGLTAGDATIYATDNETLAEYRGLNRRDAAQKAIDAAVKQQGLVNLCFAGRHFAVYPGDSVDEVSSRIAAAFAPKPSPQAKPWTDSPADEPGKPVNMTA